MSSNRFRDLPNEILNSHFFPRFKEQDYYSLRLVDKFFQQKVADTPVGGSINKLIDIRPPSFHWLLTHKFIGESFGSDAFLSMFGAGLLTSSLNGALQGYFVNGVSEIFRYTFFQTYFINFCVSAIPSLLITGMDAIFIDSGIPTFFSIIYTLASSNLIGIFSSQAIGYQCNFFNSSINVNPSISPGLKNKIKPVVNILTGLEAISLTAWAGLHLFRFFNQDKLDHNKHRIETKNTKNDLQDEITKAINNYRHNL